MKIKSTPSKLRLIVAVLASLIACGLAGLAAYWLLQGKFNSNRPPEPTPPVIEPQPQSQPEVKPPIVEKPVVPERKKQPAKPASPPAANGPTYVNGLLVVNKSYSLPSTYAPADLTTGIGGRQYSRSIDADLKAMLKAASATGANIIITSAYRSYSTQAGLYSNYVARDGQAAADTYSARAGHSEHQTGLALDLGGANLSSDCNFSACFATSAEGKWLAANATTHGFIIRYPQGKEVTTGFMYEPWHFRYVGKTVAQDMKNKGIVALEDYLGVKGGQSY